MLLLRPFFSFSSRLFGQVDQAFSFLLFKSQNFLIADSKGPCLPLFSLGFYPDCFGFRP
jgi:hypothetical protein